MKSIQVRGARQNNLRGIDLDIPHGQWLALCGPSGSGKSSLAVQTLYAEGQRRYVESFSPYVRQFLDQIQKPAADRIAGVPPAVVVSAIPRRFGRRTTVGTYTGITEALRVMYGRLSEPHCPRCGVVVRAETPQSVAAALEGLPDGTRLMVCFRLADWWESSRQGREAPDWSGVAASLRQAGFVRLLDVRDPGAARTMEAGESGNDSMGLPSEGVWVVADRLTAGRSGPARMREAVETSMAFGSGRCGVWMEGGGQTGEASRRVVLDGQEWTCWTASRRADCPGCGARMHLPEPALFSNSSPLGACPGCEGLGEVPELSRERIIPDPGLSIRDGAIAPWRTEAYRSCLDELVAKSGQLGVPVDVPFRELPDGVVDRVFAGDPDGGFDGIDGFFRWLERKKYRMHHRVFLARWRVWRTCARCGGRQLNDDALACRLWGMDIAALMDLPAREALDVCRLETLDRERRAVAAPLLEPVRSRLAFLVETGLGGIGLARSLTTLSAGQVQRVVLAATLGTDLVRMLYVLDEPVTGLHPADIEQIVPALRTLQQRPNTLVVADHAPALIRAAQRVVELGPGSGPAGGKVVFDGTPESLVAQGASPTGLHLAGQRGIAPEPEQRRRPGGRIVLRGAAGRNLAGLDVEFPLGVLCAVTGVSGSGKSTLVRDTLLPLVADGLGQEAETPLPSRGISGVGSLEKVVWIDATPPVRSSRSIPATWIGVWDGIRKLLAETPEARSAGLKPGSFSFNVPGGRCDRCEGTGRLEIEMQFLADVSMVCEECHGNRFRPAVLEARYRDRDVAGILSMTAGEAFAHFRGQSAIQAGLKALKDAGLDYLRLGQPLDTLSRGEVQRLKLAEQLAAPRSRRTLFVLDSPAAGLHMDDITRLADSFRALLDVGHSIIIMEQVIQLVAQADWVIDLGPGADADGGRLVVTGTPEQVAEHGSSATGRYLREHLQRGEKEQESMGTPAARPAGSKSASGQGKQRGRQSSQDGPP